MKYSVYASVGSNIHPRRNILEGLRALRRETGVELTAISPVYRTRPVGMDDAADEFHNLCLELQTEAPPGDLKQTLVGLEDRQGRKRDPASVISRVLDLDILIYCPPREGFQTHPQVLREAFVIVPLADLMDPAACEDLPPDRERWLATCDTGVVLGRAEYDWPGDLEGLVRGR